MLFTQNGRHVYGTIETEKELAIVAEAFGKTLSDDISHTYKYFTIAIQSPESSILIGTGLDCVTITIGSWISFNIPVDRPSVSYTRRFPGVVQGVVGEPSEDASGEDGSMEVPQQRTSSEGLS